MSEQNDELDQGLNDARLLNYTLRVREDIVAKLVKGNSIPEDKADKSLLISALDGIDRTILTRSRIKADSKLADVSAQSVNLVANILKQLDNNNFNNNNIKREIPILPLEIEKPLIIDGEIAVGTQHLDFTTFMAKFPNMQND